MKKSYVIWGVLAALCHLPASAQVTERERPSEWSNLVEGGRFMDRIQPMRGERLSKAGLKTPSYVATICNTT